MIKNNVFSLISSPLSHFHLIFFHFFYYDEAILCFECFGKRIKINVLTKEQQQKYTKKKLDKIGKNHLVSILKMHKKGLVNNKAVRHRHSTQNIR